MTLQAGSPLELLVFGVTFLALFALGAWVLESIAQPTCEHGTSTDLTCVFCAREKQ